jgi:cAMP-dependent protein kinase regulator
MLRPKPDPAEQSRAHKDRAAELTAKGRLDAAVAEYLAVLELAPGDVYARQRVAELLGRRGEKARAIEQYLCLVGKFAVEGRLLKAIATCQLILQLDPAHGETLTMLTDLFAERDNPRSPVRIPSTMVPAIQRPSEPPRYVAPETLARIPLFSDLARAPFESMLRKFARVALHPGDVVVEEGKQGDSFFAIASGVVRVERATPGGAPRVIAEMKEGEFFGEMSLLARCPRLASVVAVTECELLKLGRSDLEQIVAEYPRVGEVVQRFYRERLVANVARASSLFGGLPAENQSALANLFRIEVHPSRTVLIEEGKRGGEGLYFLLRGECEVFHRRDDGTEERYPRLGEGDVFGEVSLLQGGPATANVRTSTPSVVLVLHREWVDQLLLTYPPVRDVIYELASRRLERTQELLAKDRLDERLV